MAMGAGCYFFGKKKRQHPRTAATQVMLKELMQDSTSLQISVRTPLFAKRPHNPQACVTNSDNDALQPPTEPTPHFQSICSGLGMPGVEHRVGQDVPEVVAPLLLPMLERPLAWSAASLPHDVVGLALRHGAERAALPPLDHEPQSAGHGGHQHEDRCAHDDHNDCR